MSPRIFAYGQHVVDAANPAQAADRIGQVHQLSVEFAHLFDITDSLKTLCERILGPDVFLRGGVADMADLQAGFPTLCVPDTCPVSDDILISSALSFPVADIPETQDDSAQLATPENVAKSAAKKSKGGASKIEGRYYFSPAEDAVLRRDWPNDVDVDDIVASLKAITGVTLGKQAVRNRAMRLGLKRQNPTAMKGPKRKAVLEAAPKALTSLVVPKATPKKGRPVADPAPAPVRLPEDMAPLVWTADMDARLARYIQIGGSSSTVAKCMGLEFNHNISQAHVQARAATLKLGWADARGRSANNDGAYTEFARAFWSRKDLTRREAFKGLLACEFYFRLNPSDLTERPASEILQMGDMTLEQIITKARAYFGVTKGAAA